MSVIKENSALERVLWDGIDAMDEIHAKTVEQYEHCADFGDGSRYVHLLAGVVVNVRSLKLRDPDLLAISEVLCEDLKGYVFLFGNTSDYHNGAKVLPWLRKDRICRLFRESQSVILDCIRLLWVLRSSLENRKEI